MQEKNKIIFLKIIKWFVFLFIAYLLNIATINGEIRPFYFASLFVLIWCNQNILLSCLIYLCASLLYLPSLDNLVASSITAFIMLAFYFLHYKVRKPLNIMLLCMYAFLSQLYTYFIKATTLHTLFSVVFEFCLGIIFLIACLIFFQSLILKRNGQRLNLEQTVCGATFLGAISLSLISLNFYVEPAIIFAVFIIFLFSIQTPASSSVVVAIILGLGASLNSLNMTYLILFSTYAIMATMFTKYNQYLSLFGVLAMDLFIQLFILSNSYSWVSPVAIILGFLLFISFKKHFTPTLSQYFFYNYEKLNLKNIVNRNQEYQYRQLLEISQVFNEMDRVFRSMAKGSLPLKEAKLMLVQELSSVLCRDCHDRSHCLRLTTKQTMELFDVVISIALEKGKITLIDIPPALSQKCAKVNSLISTVNNMVVQYKKYCTMQTNMDASKLLVGEQMGGIAKIMQNLAINLNQNIDFDTKKENAIMEELNYSNIECNEVIVYKLSSNHNVSTCLLIINSLQLYADKISKIVSKILKSPFNVTQIEDSSLKGYSNVYLKATPKYDVIFGASQIAKAGTDRSGDTYSTLKLSNSKILFAISDGMGSGDKAYRASATAISLIENFYKAGFDNETIFSTVNKLLTLSSNEIFSALDICVFDLELGLMDIIKIGAPQSFIKHKFQTEILQTGALPLGILEELKPYISRHAIEHGDMIIMVSDGVLDSFESLEQASIFINNLTALNPQTLAEQILAQAIDLNNQSPNDDMTVLVGRVIQRV